MNQFSIWLQASRPKTLIASIAPVALGAVAAWPAFHLATLLWTFVAALAVQIGTNFANDYFDFLKGADTKERKGPLRVTSAGLVSPKQMQFAIATAFTTVILASSYLALENGIAIALLGIIAVALGLAYTAGPLPLAYLGLGDLFVLIFFGPVASVGTSYLQTGTFMSDALWLGWGCGFISTGILTINNLRDIEEDSKTGKKTLCVRFGSRFGQWEYACCLAAPIAIAVALHRPLVAAILTLPAIGLVWQSRRDLSGPQWNRLLAQTGQFLLLYTLTVILTVCARI